MWAPANEISFDFANMSSKRTFLQGNHIMVYHDVMNDVMRDVCKNWPFSLISGVLSPAV
jgi:hypothetical protein